MAKDFTQAGEVIAERLLKLSNNNVLKTLKKIDARAIALQKKFFSYLTTSGTWIIGSRAAPHLPRISMSQPNYPKLGQAPGWTETTGDYNLRKQKELGGGTDDQNFYLYRGGLKRYLANTGNPLTAFGNPMVSYAQLGQKGSVAAYTGSTSRGFVGRAFDSKHRRMDLTQFKAKMPLGNISVDLFPKITEPLISFRFEKYFKSAPLIRHKLTSIRGEHTRGFLPQYVQWWINVKGKEMLRKAVA